jgi:hypothetical protein
VQWRSSELALTSTRLKRIGPSQQSGLDSCNIVCFERQAPAYYPKENYAAGPHVSGKGLMARRGEEEWGDDFGRAVQRRANWGTRPSPVRKRCRQAKVADLDKGRARQEDSREERRYRRGDNLDLKNLYWSQKEDIFRFQVAMDDVLPMEVTNCRQDLREYEASLALSQSAFERLQAAYVRADLRVGDAAHQPFERTARSELEHEHEAALAVQHVQEANNVVVLQYRRCERLARNTLSITDGRDVRAAQEL